SKVASALRRLTSSGKRFLGTKEAAERHEVVIPVVVTRDREDDGIGHPASERRRIRLHQTLLIERTRRDGIDLVAAENEDLTALGLMGTARGPLESVHGSEGRRNRIRRVPPVADIGSKVEPHLLPERGPRRDRCHLFRRRTE